MKAFYKGFKKYLWDSQKNGFFLIFAEEQPWLLTVIELSFFKLAKVVAPSFS